MAPIYLNPPDEFDAALKARGLLGQFDPTTDPSSSLVDSFRITTARELGIMNYRAEIHSERQRQRLIDEVRKQCEIEFAPEGTAEKILIEAGLVRSAIDEELHRLSKDIESREASLRHLEDTRLEDRLETGDPEVRALLDACEALQDAIDAEEAEIRAQRDWRFWRHWRRPVGRLLDGPAALLLGAAVGFVIIGGMYAAKESLDAKFADTLAAEQQERIAEARRGRGDLSQISPRKVYRNGERLTATDLNADNVEQLAEIQRNREEIAHLKDLIRKLSGDATTVSMQAKPQGGSQ